MEYDPVATCILQLLCVRLTRTFYLKKYVTKTFVENNFILLTFVSNRFVDELDTYRIHSATDMSFLLGSVRSHLETNSESKTDKVALH